MEKGGDVAEIPEFDHNGNLPPGVHDASIEDIGRRFVWNRARRMLFAGLARALSNLALGGVRYVWIGGSFVTSKGEPNDVDGCWEYERRVVVDKLDPVFLDVDPPREAMRRKYGVDFLILGTPLVDRTAGGRRIEEFFQVDRDGRAKGVVRVKIGPDR